MHSRPPEGAEEIFYEYLWYNRSILIDKKPIFFKSWNEGGIKQISDVMKFNGLIRFKEDLANEFGIHIDIMKYNSLISAIPSKWRQCVRGSEVSCHASLADGEIIVRLRKGNKNVLSTQCKDYYKEFVNIKCERPTALYRWEEIIIMLILTGLFYLRFLINLHVKLMYKVCNSR